MLCAALLCLDNVAGWSQVKKDTTNVGFDATQQAFQRRYRYPDEVPYEKGWIKNLSFSVFGGMDQFVPRGDGDFNTGPVAGFGVNWRFARSHSLRTGFQIGTFGRKIDNETLTRMGVQADYLLNVTSFMKGYNPGRLFEVSTVAGAGYQLVSFLDKKEHVADLHLGLQFKLHPTPHADFYIEPRVSFLTDGIDHSDQKNWHKYDITYGAVVGMTYYLKPWKPFGGIDLLDGEKLLDNTFVSVSAGPQFQISKLTNELGMTKAIGPHTAVSVGKWLIPGFGLRASLFQSADTWHSKVMRDDPNSESEYTLYEMSTYAGGRLEAMLDVTSFFYKKDSTHTQKPKFSLNLLAGGEVGIIRKENGFDPAKGGYTGFTGGMQFKYRLFDDLSVFLEPRVSMASFTLKTGKKEEGRFKAERYTDNLFNLNFGIEVALSDDETRKGRSNDKLDYFHPSLFVSAGAGMGVPLQMKRFRLKNYFDYQAMVAVGYTFTPISSVRLSGDFGPYSNDLRNGAIKYNMASGSLDYMLNLSNLMMEYDFYRKYDVQLLAGVVGSMRMKPSREVQSEDLNKSGFFLGLETGIHASYQVLDFLKVFVEPKARFYSNKLLMQSSIQSHDTMLMLHAGATYTF